MIKINTKISTLALVCLLLGVGSCSREDDSQSGGKLLKVNVQMAASPMVTRGAVAPSIVSDTIDMGNDLVLVATSRPRDYEPQEALTRGTPIKSAANLPSLNVKVYNSGTASFSGSTALTATLKGTNSSGAWSLSPSYMITDGVKNTYMAYSPIEDAGNGNGIAVAGRTLTYTAPTTVTNQPDLCTSTIVKDDVSSNLPLAMQHRLTAVGIKVSADNVTIDEIKINNIYSSGVLNLETGEWSGLSEQSNFAPTLTTTTPATGGAMNDITAANGYLMLPPQTFANDNQTVTVKFTYTGGAQQTATYKLKDLTGGKWEAGQIVTYEIQLKAKFSLTFSPASLTLTEGAGIASFTYSTNSPSANDPQFTNAGNAWITNLKVNRSTKTVTFNYAAYTTSGSRTAAIKTISGWTSTDYSVTQKVDPKVYVSESTWNAGSGIGGQTKTITVTTNGCRWRVVDPGKDGSRKHLSRVELTRPSGQSGLEGANGESVIITLKGNPTFDVNKKPRNFDVRFEAVDLPSSFATLNITQQHIVRYEVSNKHTAFVPPDFMMADYKTDIWSADNSHDLQDNQHNIGVPKPGPPYGPTGEGFRNAQYNYGYINALRHCRTKFGDRGFVPSRTELVMYNTTQTSSGPARFGLKHRPGYKYVYATSDVENTGKSSDNKWIVVIEYNGYSYTSVESKVPTTNRHDYLFHRCYYKGDI